MTDESIRGRIEARKEALRTEEREARTRKIVDQRARLEIAVEDAVRRDPTNPLLQVAANLLATGNAEEALFALLDGLGEERARELMSRIFGQLQLTPPPGHQPQQLVVPEYIDVYDENGQLEGWSIRSSDNDARQRIEHNGYRLVRQGGVMVYKKTRAIAPAESAGPAVTRQQPAADVGHAGRRRWAGSRTPRQGD